MRLLRSRQLDDETPAPDVSFADTLPAPDETAVLRLGLSRADLADELDQERMARADAEEQVRLLREELVEWKQAARAEADHADDLGSRSLPNLPGAVLTDAQPVGALLYDALVAETGVDPQAVEALSEPLHGTWTPPPLTDWDTWTGSVGE